MSRGALQAPYDCVSDRLTLIVSPHPSVTLWPTVPLAARAGQIAETKYAVPPTQRKRNGNRLDALLP